SAAANSPALKLVAITSSERLPAMPAVPTTAEAGLPEFRMSIWTGLFAPKATPRPAILKLNYALNRGLEDQSTRQRLFEMWGEIPTRHHRSPEALAALLRADTDT